MCHKNWIALCRLMVSLGHYAIWMQLPTYYFILVKRFAHATKCSHASSEHVYINWEYNLKAVMLLTEVTCEKEFFYLQVQQHSWSKHYEIQLQMQEESSLYKKMSIVHEQKDRSIMIHSHIIYFQLFFAASFFNFHTLTNVVRKLFSDELMTIISLK
jgi:hypothetical protein